MAKKLKVVAVDHSDRGHSRVSPSKLGQFEGCPGYESKDQKGPLHPVTLEGIDCHEALDSGNWKKLTPELNELVVMCQDYVDDLCGAGREVSIHKEECLNITPDIWGYCDLILIRDDTHAEVVDYKFGWHPVKDAEENLQGMAYVVGAFLKWPDLKTATMHFLQPRLGSVSTFDFKRKDVDTILLRIETIVEKVRQWDSAQTADLLHPSPSNCVWCTRKLVCPAFAKTVHSILGNPLVDREFDADDPEFLSEALAAIPSVERWIKDVRQAAVDKRVDEGVEIPGFDLQVRAGRPKFTDTLEVYDELKDILEVSDILECSTVSVSKLRDKVAQKVDRGQKGLAKSTLLADLEAKGILVYGDEVRSLRKTKN